MKNKKILTFLFVFLLVSCGNNNSKNDEMTYQYIDEVVFDYVSTFNIDDEKYDFYLPLTINESLFYLYSESNCKVKSELITINYSFYSQYIYGDDLTSKQKEKFYDLLILNKNVIDNATKFISNIYKFDEKVSEEVTFTNALKEEISFVILTTYLPVKFKKDNLMYVIYVPLMNQYLLLKENLIYNPFTLSMTNYEEFKKNKNLSERKN